MVSEHCIAAMAEVRRDGCLHKERLERELEAAEQDYRAHPGPHRLCTVNNMCGGLRSLEIIKAEMSILRMKNKYYARGIKLGPY